MGIKTQRKFFKEVKELSCIFCDGAFPLDQQDFKTINRHGWGCCQGCWDKGEHTKTAKPGEIICYEFRAVS